MKRPTAVVAFPVVYENNRFEQSKSTKRTGEQYKYICNNVTPKDFTWQEKRQHYISLYFCFCSSCLSVLHKLCPIHNS